MQRSAFGSYLFRIIAGRVRAFRFHAAHNECCIIPTHTQMLRKSSPPTNNIKTTPHGGMANNSTKRHLDACNLSCGCADAADVRIFAFRPVRGDGGRMQTTTTTTTAHWYAGRMATKNPQTFIHFLVYRVFCVLVMNNFAKAGGTRVHTKKPRANGANTVC